MCNFHLLFVVIFVAIIVVVNCISGRDCYVVINLVTIICLPEGGAGVVGVYFVECHFCDFTHFFIIVVVALIVVQNRLLGKDG